MTDITRPVSKHFTLQQAAESVYAAIATDGGAAICNAGIIDLGGQVVVFDTFLTPQAARDLRQAAINLFGRTPQIVVDSHYHNDHIWGNQVFANEAQILSSTRTRQLITSEGLKDVEWYTANAAQQLVSYQTQFENASDEQRHELKLMLGYYAGLAEALPRFSLCLPGVTFDQRLTLHGTKRTAELITFENAHTASDTVLYLPQEGVLFMSDLLFIDFHPYLGGGDPQGQQAALRELIRMEAKCFVPGHGSLGTRDDLQLLVEYIDYCTETARALVAEGNGYEDKIAGLKIAQRYQHWKLASFFPGNISFLCKRLDPAVRT
jgi:cyclase